MLPQNIFCIVLVYFIIGLTLSFGVLPGIAFFTGYMKYYNFEEEDDVRLCLNTILFWPIVIVKYLFSFFYIGLPRLIAEKIRERNRKKKQEGRDK